MRGLPSALVTAAMALGFVPIPSLATTPAPLVTAANVNVTENAGTASIVLTKAKAGSYSKVTLQTVDGTAKAGIDYTPVNLTVTLGNSVTRYAVPVAILNNATYQGTRSFTVKLTSVRFAQVQAPVTVTIADDEAPPVPSVTWTKCADENGTCTISGTANVRYGSGSTWVTKSVTGAIGCNNGVFGDPVVGTVKECDTDGTVIAPSPVPTPTPDSQWVSAPLQDGGFARVKNANDSLWPMTGPGSGRPLVNGEIVAVYFNGWGYQADGQPSFAIFALSDQTSGRALMSNLEGIAPVGSPPPLPGNWWVPGLVKAVKTCESPTNPSHPGVVQGGIYRAAMVSGTHMKLADGVTGAPSVMWLVFATGGLQYSTGETVVMGDCLVGLAAP